MRTVRRRFTQAPMPKATPVKADPAALKLFNQRCLRWAKGFDPQYVEIVLALSSFTNLDSGNTFPSQRTIIEKIRAKSFSKPPSTSTLKRRMAELRDHDIISSVQRRGSHNHLGHPVTTWRTNAYTLHFDRVIRDGCARAHDFETIFIETEPSASVQGLTPGLAPGASSAADPGVTHITSLLTSPITDKETRNITNTKPPPEGAVASIRDPAHDKTLASPVSDPEREADPERLVCLAEDLMKTAAKVVHEPPRTFSPDERKILRATLRIWLRQGTSAYTITKMLEEYFGRWQFSQHPEVFSPAKQFISLRSDLAAKVFNPDIEIIPRTSPQPTPAAVTGDAPDQPVTKEKTAGDIATIFCAENVAFAGAPTVAHHAVRDWIQTHKDEQDEWMTNDDLWNMLDRVTEDLGHKMCTLDFTNGTAHGIADKWLKSTSMERHRYDPAYWH
jgi:hypothetical protein